MKNIIAVLSVVIVLLCAVSIKFYKRYKREHALRSEKEYYSNVLKSDFDKLNHYRSREFTVNGLNVNDTKVKGDNGEVIMLSEIIQQPTLIFNFTERCCLACVDDYLVILNQLNNRVPEERIIVLTRYDKLNKMKIKKSVTGSNLSFYNLSEPLDLPLDVDDKIHDKPYFIMLDNDLKVSYPRVGWSEDSITNPYFDRVTGLLQGK